MTAHLKYLSYVLRHKWFVFLAGLQTGAPIHQLIIHDWHKFLPSEWFPYVDHFYRQHTSREAVGYYHTPESAKENFNRAWRLHLQRGRHHWAHWVSPYEREDEDPAFVEVMPEHYVREMVADWIGASRTQGVGRDIRPWYEKNKQQMVLARPTRELVESLVAVYGGGE